MLEHFKKGVLFLFGIDQVCRLLLDRCAAAFALAFLNGLALKGNACPSCAPAQKELLPDPFLHIFVIHNKLDLLSLGSSQTKRAKAEPFDCMGHNDLFEPCIFCKCKRADMCGAQFNFRLRKGYVFTFIGGVMLFSCLVV